MAGRLGFGGGPEILSPPFSLLADPAGLDGAGELFDRRVGRQVGEVVLAFACRSRLPDKPDLVAGQMLSVISWIRCVGPSATRTRTAAKWAESVHLVPRRQLTWRHFSASSVACADTEVTSGIAFFLGHPRAATGKTMPTSNLRSRPPPLPKGRRPIPLSRYSTLQHSRTMPPSEPLVACRVLNGKSHILFHK